MKKFLSLILSLIACFMLFSCDDKESSSTTPPVVDDGDPYEYKEVVHVDDNNRVFYEIFVGAFADSNGDGMGDLRGVINKLDYLNDLMARVEARNPGEPEFHQTVKEVLESL
jgi:hypothetical protein